MSRIIFPSVLVPMVLYHVKTSEDTEQRIIIQMHSIQYPQTDQYCCDIRGFYKASTTAIFLILGFCLLLSLAFRFSFPSFVVRFLLDILPLVFAAAPTNLNIFPPQTVHIPEMPLRPFFVLTRFSSLISRLTLHFIQYPSVVNLPYFSCFDIRLALFDAWNILLILRRFSR